MSIGKFRSNSGRFSNLFLEVTLRLVETIILKTQLRHIAKLQPSRTFFKFEVKMSVKHVRVGHTVMVQQVEKPIVMLEIIVKKAQIIRVLQVVQSVTNVQTGSRIHARQELIKMSQIKIHANNVRVEFIVKLQEVQHPQVINVLMDTFVKRVLRENIQPRTPREMTTMARVLLVTIVETASKENVFLDNTKTKLIKVDVKIVLLVSFVMALVLKHSLVLNVLLAVSVWKEQQAKKHVPRELTEVKMELEAVLTVSHVKVVTFVVQALPVLITLTYVPSVITAS